MSISLFEAFNELKQLNEEDFNITNDDVDELKDFVDTDEEDDTIDVVDLEAEDEEDLKDNYIDNVILECTVCHTKIYKEAQDVSIDEDGEIANMGEECPYCYSSDGYKIIGQVAPYSATEVNVEVEPKDAEDSDESTKSDDETADLVDTENEIVEESLTEGIQNIDVETENDNIHIQAEEKVETDAEMIAPLEASTKEVFDPQENPSEETETEVEEPIEGEEGDEVDFEMDEFDEDSFDGLGESYLKNVYENVESFKTTKVTSNERQLTLEGVIKFNSGKTKTTRFVFEAKDATRQGKVRFIGENKQLSRGKKSFTLVGRINENKLISESLNYNYRAKNDTGKSTRVYGTVKSK